jgi:hypothetical protein
VVPLGGPKAKIQDALPSLVEAKFQLLIATEQLWYDLLLEIGFTTGDVLPFSTKNFMLPETSPTMHLIGQASEHLQTIDTKLQDTEEARLVKLEEERAKEMKRAADAMKKAADDRVAKEKQQLEAATKRMEMLKEQHEQRLEAKLKDAEKQKEEAAILRRRVEEFKMFIEGLQRTSTVNDKDLEKLKELAEDPAFADQVLEDMPSDEEPSEPSSLADIINRIRHAHAISKLTASQPNPGPSMRMKSGNKAKATSSNIIDITHSDDEYDMGESSVIHQQLQQIPWGSFGLSTDLIGPAVHAIKSMDGEDKALFTNPINVKQIFKFGIRGLKDRWASQSEGSAASDSNSKRSYSGSAGGVTKKIRSMQVADNNVPVSKKKGKGKQCRRQRAIYTDDEDEDMEDGNDETPRSPDSPGGVSMLINEV